MWFGKSVPGQVSLLVVEISQAYSAAIDFGKLFSLSFDFLSFHTARVKNGPDAIEMGCLRYPQKQTSVSAAAMTDPDPNPFADCDYIRCYGGAKLADKHLGSTIHCVDEEIIELLRRRERRRHRNGSRVSYPGSLVSSLSAPEILP
jgi:hypothetical protein